MLKHIGICTVAAMLTLAMSLDAWGQCCKKGEAAMTAAKCQEMIAAGKCPMVQWKLGTQAYTFKEFTLFEAIDKAKALGLKYIEMFPGQRLSPEQRDVAVDQNVSPAIMAKIKNKLDEAGIQAVSFGVVGIDKEEAKARVFFDFAKLMGIGILNCEPSPDQMEMLDKLANEYQIKIAIHNHPKPSAYWNPDNVLKVFEGRSKMIGSCADTGHWVRSGLDPIECLKKLEGHIVMSHFKDLNEKTPAAHDVVWGTGVNNVEAELKELDRQGFVGPFIIEYEYNWLNSMPEIAKCIEYFNKIAGDLGKLAPKCPMMQKADKPAAK